MRIELFGDNCRRCQTLQNNIELALQSHGDSHEFQQIDDVERFANYGLLSLPAFAIDGEVLAAGRLLNVEEIIEMMEK